MDGSASGTLSREAHVAEPRFTQEELTAMRAAGVAVFEGRVLHEAQPSITPEVLAAIEARCSGPVPEALVALWRTSFGGRVDYDLSLRLSDTIAGFSFTELFYPESDGYRDLWGWMEQQLEFEQEAAEDAGQTHDGRLRFLPFGGFEYTDRLFVDLRDGSVVAYLRGLPRAWVLRLHEDATGRVAKDVRALFRQLDLEDDPYAPTREYANGAEVRDAIDAVESESARAKLHELLRAVVVDWRAAVADGSVTSDARARRLAWGEVTRTDDLALLERLLDLGCSPAEELAGRGAPVDHAAANGSRGVVRRLLALEVPVDGALEAGSAVLPQDLCRALAARGARIGATAVSSSCRNPDEDVCCFLGELLASRHPDAVPALVRDLREGAARQEASAVRVESGSMGSNWTPARYRELAARMTTLADHVAALTVPAP